MPDFDSIKAGTAASLSLQTTGPALVLWGHIFGGRAGDTVNLQIAGPHGLIHEATDTLERTQARLFRASGRRTPPEGWRPGLYIGEVILRRDGQIIDRSETQVTVE